MDSITVHVPYVICLTNPIWRHPRWRYPKWRPFVTCYLAAMHTLSKQLHSTTTLEGNRVHFMFTARQPLRIHCPGGRRPPKVYEFATVSDWCTDGWHRTKLAFYRLLGHLSTVVPAMNGHPRDQAKVSVHDSWPLIRGTGGQVKDATFNTPRLSPPAIFILNTCIVLIMFAIVIKPKTDAT